MLGFESHHRSGFSLNHFHSLCGKDYEMIMILIKIRLFKTLRVVDNSFFSPMISKMPMSLKMILPVHILFYFYISHAASALANLLITAWGYNLFLGREVISCESLDLLCFTLPLLLLLSFYCFSFRVCSFPCLSFFVCFPSVVSLTRISIACLVLCSVSSSCSPRVLFSPSFLLAYVHLRCS